MTAESTSRANRIQQILRIITMLVFIGRGYQFLFFDSPLRVVLWDQSIMSGIVEFFTGMDWNSYATSPQVNLVINQIQILIGFVFLLAALGAALLSERRSIWNASLYLGVFFLLVLNLLEFKDRFYQIPIFLEHMIQIFTPLLFLWHLQRVIAADRLILWGKIVIAATFVGHGIYAIGFYPRPGHFIDLTLGSLPMTEPFASHFLTVAGWLDLIMAAALFVPQLARPALLYMTVWGLLTAVSRVAAGVYLDFFWQSFHQSFYLVLYRLCHGLLPFAIYWLQSEAGTTQKAAALIDKSGVSNT